MDEKLEIAQRAFRDMAGAALAASPLAEMAHWIASGRVPSASVLRSAGLAGDFVPRDEREGLLHFNLRIARKPFISQWGFSIPCAEAVEVLATLGPIVEVGAGTGYWTALMRIRGIDAIATDLVSTGDVGYGFQAGRYTEITPMDASAAVAKFSDRTPFCSWPTQGDQWALSAFALLRSGQRLALVGGSSTGTPSLNHYLEDQFRIIDEVELPQFPGCDDRLTIYIRK